MMNLNEHVGLEFTGLDFEAYVAKFFYNPVAQRRGKLGPGRIDETGTAAFPAIGVERELRDDQHLGVRVQR